MFVESSQNFEVLKEINFSLFGMGPRYRKRAERMKPDDRVLFYVKGLRKWPATATIASTYFEDHSPLWSPTTRNESFQYRVKLKANIVLDEEDYIDALLLAPQLEYIKRWMPEDWPLAFWERLHLLPQADFRLIEGEMQRIASKKGLVPKDDQREAGIDRDGEPSGLGGVAQQEAERGQRQEPAARLDEDEAEPETLSYPAARPDEPGRRSEPVDDDGGERKLVSYPAARPDEPGRRSEPVDDDGGEPEIVSYPAARPDEGQDKLERPSTRAHDKEEPETVSYPEARPDEGQDRPGRPSGRARDNEEESEIVSYPEARPDEGQDRPGRPSARADDAEEEPDIVSYPAARPEEWQGKPGYPAARTDDDDPEIISYPPGESVPESTEEA